MFKNFLKISFRHLWQSKLYSIINIIGLAIGIVCMLMAVLYWKEERSYDVFHKNNPHLYRVTTTLIESKSDKIHTTGGTGQVQGPAFKEQVPELQNYTRILGGDIYSDVIANNKTLHLQSIFVDEGFFDVFTFNLLRGNPKTALNDISSVVITESTARKFFNGIDVIGNLVRLDADPSFQRLGKSLVISGVVQDPPANSSLQFDALFAFKFMQLSFEDNNWLNAYLGTYVVLNPLANTNIVTRKFNDIYAFHSKEQLAQNFKSYGYDPRITYGLQRMTDIHLNPLARGNGNAEGGVINGSNPVYSYMFLGIAAFILFMAAINFVNISIANSLKRTKEAGIRKIAGSSRLQIVIQFLCESAILCLIAFVLAIILADISLPVFNKLTGKRILLGEAFDAGLFFYFVMMLAGLTLLTGFYPAYILSGFKPAEVLYNRQKLSGRNLFGRSLVVIQFSLAVFLLIATLVYYDQMNYIRTKDLGYEPHQIIRTSINGDRDYKPVMEFLRNELGREPSIKMLSFCGEGNVDEVKVDNRHIQATHKAIDENYLPTLEIPLKAGRNFSQSFPTDKTNGVIVNEAFVKAAGVEKPIGAQVNINEYYDSKAKTIIGVVKDFHFGSLREPIQPMVMFMSDGNNGSIWIKFEKGKQREATAALQHAYKKILPTAVFRYNFLDELNAKQYVQEERWQQVISFAAALSFMICCLGLFGLAHLGTHQRVKEIGIRKVLGASVSQIVALLSADFLKLVMIAFITAVPMASLVMNKWLQYFAYRINISWWVFVIAGISAISIALITISFQAIKAAMANPVKSLRSE
ncbi:MAG: ABC transporter permease [Ginsengibacter sp.]